MSSLSYYDWAAGAKEPIEPPFREPGASLTESIRIALDAHVLNLPSDRTLELMEQRAGFGIDVEEWQP